MSTWQLQEAKARFSELIHSAETEGPQTITRRGVETAVVVPIELWERIPERRRTSAPSQPQLPVNQLSNAELLKFLQSAPDFEIPDRHADRVRRRRRQSA